MQESSQTQSCLLLLDQWIYQSVTFSAENTHMLYTSSICVIMDHNKNSSDCMIVTKLQKMQSRLEFIVQ